MKGQIDKDIFTLLLILDRSGPIEVDFIYFKRYILQIIKVLLYLYHTELYFLHIAVSGFFGKIFISLLT